MPPKIHTRNFDCPVRNLARTRIVPDVVFQQCSGPLQKGIVSPLGMVPSRRLDLDRTDSSVLPGVAFPHVDLASLCREVSDAGIGERACRLRVLALPTQVAEHDLPKPSTVLVPTTQFSKTHHQEPPSCLSQNHHQQRIFPELP